MFIYLVGADVDLFKYAPAGTLYHDLYKEKIYQGEKGNGDVKMNGVFSLHEGLDRLLNSNGKETYYSSLEAVRTAMTIEKYGCKFVAPYISNFPSYLSMALPKGSPYRSVSFLSKSRFFYYFN